MDHLESIRIFVKVAETSSFSRAAEQLCLSTAVVSRYVVALEKRLNARLFRRTTRHISLTDAGSAFLEHAQVAVARLDEAEAKVSRREQQLDGTLRIASPVSFGVHILPLILQRFTEIHPAVTPHVILADDAAGVVERGVDVAVVVEGEATSNTLVTRRFATYQVKLVASSAYIQRRDVRRANGLDTDLALLLQTRKLAAASPDLSKHLGDASRCRKVGIVTNSLELIRRLAIDGHGIAALPEFLICKDVESRLLVELEPEAAIAPLHMCIAFETRHNMPHRLRAFLDFVADWQDHDAPRLRCGAVESYRGKAGPMMTTRAETVSAK